jgi:hypothetical protein
LFNARSLVNKLTELNDLLCGNKYDIILVTETWLNDTIPDSFVCTHCYDIFRADRDNKRGGGVAVLFRKNLHLTLAKLPESFVLPETIVFDLNIKNEEKIRFILCYRAPNYDIEHVANLCRLLEFSTNNLSKCVILGDFNLPSLHFGQTLDFNKPTTDPVTSRFYDTLLNLGVEQLVNYPTRGNNYLDLIFTTCPFITHNVSVEQPFSTSDHSSVTFSIITKDDTMKPNTQSHYNFRKANYPAIELELAKIDWPATFSNCVNVNDFYNKFLRILHDIISRHVPKMKISENMKYPVHIKRLKIEKKSLWKLYKKSRTDENKIQLKAKCKQLKETINEHYATQEINLLKSSSLHSFYKFVNNRLSNHKSVPVLTENGILISENKDKCDKLNQYFGSVFTVDDMKSQTLQDRFVDASKTKMSVAFDFLTTLTALKNLKPSNSVGPDGLCAYFLQKLHLVLAQPLKTIFEISYQTGSIPDVWSKAIVVPVFKKGDSALVENYRPISLCCVSCKVMESIINCKIVSHLDQKKLLSDKQFGFRKNKSCTLQLLECTDKWSTQLDQKTHIDVVYVDFQKAFDSVSHEKLLTKLKAYGINDLILNWIKCFLKNRLQRVKICDSYSDFVDVTSGVPQGSVLGPTLFLLFINDLCDHIVSEMCLFADDVKIFNSPANHDILQNDLTYLYEWAKTWQLQISLPKCNVLYMGNNNPCLDYNINNCILPHNQNEVKDLGIIISGNLSSTNHCNYVTKKAMRVSNLIHRCFVSKNTELQLKAFKTYVRPILEYSSVVWNPHSIGDIKLVERVQRRFTKRIIKDKNMSYDERLTHLNIERLELRRLYIDLCTLYSIIYDSLLPFENLFTYNINQTRAVNSLKLVFPKCHMDIKKFCFSNRIVPVWNALPNDVVHASSIDRFKVMLKKCDLSKYLRGVT